MTSTDFAKMRSDQTVHPDRVPIWRMSVDQYLAAARIGIFDKYDKIELLEGFLIEKYSPPAPYPGIGFEPSDLDDAPMWRLPVDKYIRLIKAGIITDDDPVELLEGLLVAKMTKNEPHITAQDLINRRFNRLVPDSWFVSIERPIRALRGIPEPDITLVKGDPRDYRNVYAPPEAVGIVIEISDTTLAKDRTIKVNTYAGINIPFYWIVNLRSRQIEVFTDPQPDADPPRYDESLIYGAADSIPLILDGEQIATIPVADLLP